MAWIDKTVGKGAKKIEKLARNIPGVGLAEDIGGEVLGAAKKVGEALGLVKTAADYRKERYRKFHTRLYAGDWAEVQNVAQNSQYKDLAKEALWVLRQKALGYSLADITAKIKGTEDGGTGGAAARRGTLANLDGSPNTSEEEWQSSSHGTAASAGASSGEKPPPATSSSAPVAPPRSQPRQPAAPRPCAYGPRVDGFCPKKPKAAPVSGTGSGTSRPAAAKRPCAYGPRDPVTNLCPKKQSSAQYLAGKPKPPCTYGPRVNGLCPKKPKANKALTAAQKRAETAVATGITKGAQYVYKNFGPLGTLTLISQAALVGAAGVGAYFLTKKLATLRPKNWQDARYELSKATLAARKAMRESRPDLDWNDPKTNAAEMKPFDDYFKQRLDIINKSEAMGVEPHLEFIFDDDNPTYGNPYTNVS